MNICDLAFEVPGYKFDLRPSAAGEFDLIVTRDASAEAPCGTEGSDIALAVVGLPGFPSDELTWVSTDGTSAVFRRRLDVGDPPATACTDDLVAAYYGEGADV